MAAKYPDCESCAFYGVEPAICDECEDADQWEPADDEDYYSASGCRKVIKIQKRSRYRELEAA